MHSNKTSFTVLFNNKPDSIACDLKKVCSWVNLSLERTVEFGNYYFFSLSAFQTLVTELKCTELGFSVTVWIKAN